MIKTYISILILLLAFLIAPLANAHNPFITKPESQHTAPKPIFKSKLFVNITIWQIQLKNKMSSLVRQAEATKSIKPLFLLLMLAFAYGVIHAAGPGHGKALALSYVLAQRPGYVQGMIFSNAMALFHGTSGILFVIFIRLILNTTISQNLETVTHITQIVSYSLIALLGLGLLIHSIYKLIKNKNAPPQPVNQKHTIKPANPLLFALVVGCIPCPGVVMVMLFALSMELITLGILLGIMISIGMALTISLVVIMVMSGKVASIAIAGQKNELANTIEYWIEIIGGLSLITLGTLFLGANL